MVRPALGSGIHISPVIRSHARRWIDESLARDNCRSGHVSEDGLARELMHAQEEPGMTRQENGAKKSSRSHEPAVLETQARLIDLPFPADGFVFGTRRIERMRINDTRL